MPGLASSRCSALGGGQINCIYRQQQKVRSHSAVVLDAAAQSSPPLGQVQPPQAQRALSVSDAMESLHSEVSKAAQLQAAQRSQADAAGAAAGGETMARAHKEARRPWNSDEDQRLLAAARAQGFGEGTRQGVWKPDWTVIASSVGNRKPKQCRERLFDNLDPTVDHTPLTSEEEQVLLELVRVHGTKWVVISRAMPQRNGRRPGNQLKNNWNRIKHKDRRREKRSKPAASGESQGQESTASVDWNQRQQTAGPATAAVLPTLQPATPAEMRAVEKLAGTLPRAQAANRSRISAAVLGPAAPRVRRSIGQQQSRAETVTALAVSDSTMYAATTGDMLWKCELHSGVRTSGDTDSWTPVCRAVDVVALATLGDSIYALDEHSRIWVRSDCSSRNSNAHSNDTANDASTAEPDWVLWSDAPRGTMVGGIVVAERRTVLATSPDGCVWVGTDCNKLMKTLPEKPTAWEIIGSAVGLAALVVLPMVAQPLFLLVAFCKDLAIWQCLTNPLLPWTPCGRSPQCANRGVAIDGDRKTVYLPGVDGIRVGTLQCSDAGILDILWTNNFLPSPPVKVQHSALATAEASSTKPKPRQSQALQPSNAALKRKRTKRTKPAGTECKRKRNGTGVKQAAGTSVTSQRAKLLGAVRTDHNICNSTHLSNFSTDRGRSVDVVFPDQGPLGIKWRNKATGSGDKVYIDEIAPTCPCQTLVTAGMILTHVAGCSILDKQFERVMQDLKAAPRPLTLTLFTDSPSHTTDNVVVASSFEANGRNRGQQTACPVSDGTQTYCGVKVGSRLEYSFNCKWVGGIVTRLLSASPGWVAMRFDDGDVLQVQLKRDTQGIVWRWQSRPSGAGQNEAGAASSTDGDILKGQQHQFSICKRQFETALGGRRSGDSCPSGYKTMAPEKTVDGDAELAVGSIVSVEFEEDSGLNYYRGQVTARTEHTRSSGDRGFVYLVKFFSDNVELTIDPDLHVLNLISGVDSDYGASSNAPVRIDAWSQDEEHQLMDMVRIYGGGNWEAKAEALGSGRTGKAVCARYYKMRDNSSAKQGAHTAAVSITSQRAKLRCKRSKHPSVREHSAGAGAAHQKSTRAAGSANFTAKMAAPVRVAQAQCLICQEHFKDMASERPVSTLNCDHRFCSECLEGWFVTAEKRTCPVCRKCYASLRHTTKTTAAAVAVE